MDQEIFIYIYSRFSNNLKKLDIEGMIWIDCFEFFNPWPRKWKKKTSYWISFENKLTSIFTKIQDSNPLYPAWKLSSTTRSLDSQRDLPHLYSSGQPNDQCKSVKLRSPSSRWIDRSIRSAASMIVQPFHSCRPRCSTRAHTEKEKERERERESSEQQ